MRYGGGRTRGRKRGGQQVQQMATLQAAVHGMCNLAHLLAQKGGGKAAAEGEHGACSRVGCGMGNHALLWPDGPARGDLQLGD